VTTTNNKRPALGRGLSALIPGASTLPASPLAARRDYFECAIEDVHPSADNPRQRFDEQKLNELAESIRNQGLVQPLVVRQRSAQEGGGFWLIAGERRWRAAQRAGLKSIPVVVKEVQARAAYELTLVENLQREDLNPIEEAEAYHRLSAEFGYTQEALAQRVGKDRATVANALRLLKLPDKVRNLVASGELQMGHARALLGLEAAHRTKDGVAVSESDSGVAIERAAARVVQKQLSVRQTEELVRRERGEGKSDKPAVAGPPSTASTRDLEQRLERALGTKVRLVQKTAQAGKIEVDYHSLDQLDSLLEKLLGNQ
jgi:ParB family transcriptional regulator, chromosome partitioning protein